MNDLIEAVSKMLLIFIGIAIVLNYMAYMSQEITQINDNISKIEEKCS